MVCGGISGLLLTSAAMAGPFGFDLEDPRKPSEAYRFCENTEGGVNFACTTAPKPHPDMEGYVVRFVEGVGTCQIMGLSRDVYDGGSGIIFRHNVDNIANQLKHKYGQWGQKVDTLIENTIFDQPSEWMFSLTRGERAYSYIWFSSDLSIEHHNRINSIILTALPSFERSLTNMGKYGIVFNTSLEDICEEAMSDVF